VACRCAAFVVGVAALLVNDCDDSRLAWHARRSSASAQPKKIMPAAYSGSIIGIERRKISNGKHRILI